MLNSTVITVVGNLTDNPELRFTPSGVPMARFTVAVNPRVFDKATGEWRDGVASFHNSTAQSRFQQRSRHFCTASKAERPGRYPKLSAWKIGSTLHIRCPGPRQSRECVRLGVIGGDAPLLAAAGRA